MRSLSPKRFGFPVDGLFLSAAAFAWLAGAQAGPPKVAFDVSYTVECRDATPPEFEESHPGRKIVEARFEVSSLIRSGRESDVDELMYVIRSPQRRLRVFDFEPKTQMESDVAKAIEVVETDEDATSLNGGLSAQISPGGGVHVAPSAGASKATKNSLQQKYSKLPPKQLLVASGTTLREYGVFFKLKPSTQASLEGQRELVCLFVVPSDWRADYAYVDCIARVRNRSPWTKSPDVGSRRVLVGLYLQGDAEARGAAERLAHAYEAYVSAGEPRPGAAAEPADEAARLLRRLPGLSVVGSVIDDLSSDDQATAKRKDEAWESFSTAMDDLERFAG
jgi:hypothetical protein